MSDTPENVNIVSEEAVISETAGETSTTNEVSDKDLNDLKTAEEEAKTEEPKTEGTKTTSEGKKLPSPKYYKAFSNGALTAVDKLYEMIAEFMFEPEVDTRGLKKLEPEDFKDNVNLLAEQLELTEVEIKALLGWVVVGGTILAPYGKLVAQKSKENKAIKKEKAEALAEQIKAKAPVTDAPVSEVEAAVRASQEIENKLRGEKGGKAKPGLSRNWKLHPQPCDCNNCKIKRDKDGNILAEYEIVK